MSSLKLNTFLGAMPYMDPSLLPQANSWANRDCWFVDGTLRPIKDPALDATTPAPPAGTETMYRYRPCPKDPALSYWIHRPGFYNVAPSPVANDKYSRLYFSRRSYTASEIAELPHFYDVKGLLGRTSNEDICNSSNPTYGTYSANDPASYTLGVPSPVSASVEYKGGEFALATSTDGTTWSQPDAYKGTAYAFLTVFSGTASILAGGYNGAIAYSQDGGGTWSPASVPDDAATYTIRCFAETWGVIIAGCNDGRLLTSTDNGATWTIPDYCKGLAFVEGHITAAITHNYIIYIGTTAGYVRRLKTVNQVLAKPTDSENPWQNEADLTKLFRVSGTNETTVHPIYGAVVVNDPLVGTRAYFVGGNKKGRIARNTASSWEIKDANATVGPIISIAANAAKTQFIVATSSSYRMYTNTYSSWPEVNVHSDTFAGASFFKTAAGSRKNLRYAGFTGNGTGSPFLVGEKGAFAFLTYAGGADYLGTWNGPPTSFGETPLNYVAYLNSKYILVGNDQAATAQEVQARYYAITFVDGFGAESAPILTTKVSATANGAFTLGWKNPTFYVREDGTPITSEVWTGNAYATRVNKAGAKFYIYRTASSGTSTEFLYVDKVNFAAESEAYTYDDSKKDEALGEVMPSTDWVPPPPKLRGLVSLPSGVLAGFVDNTLWFSEPGQPQAWPVKYQRTVNAPIVGLSTFANSVLVTTINRSFIASGVDPFNMTLTELETDQACISADSVVDMGGSAIYASPRGLVRVSNMTPEWITKQLFTPAQWAQLDPASIRATVWEGRYLCFFDGQPSYASYGVDGVATYPAAMSIVPGADVDGVTWYTATAHRAFIDPYDDKVYFLNGTSRYIWNGGETNAKCFWRSKLFQSPESLGFSWLQVQGEVYETTVRYYSEEGSTLAFEAVIGVTNATTRVTPFTATEYHPDGTVKATFSGNAMDGTVRLPAGRRSRFHVIEIETRGQVRQTLFAQSSEELRTQ